MALPPAKSKFGEPCSGCGLCCRLELCEIAQKSMPEAVAPCPALEWENGRTWCGLTRHPARHLKANFDGMDAVLIPLFTKAQSYGQGCGMTDEEDAL